MSFSSLVLLDRIIEENIISFGLNISEEISISLYEDGLNLSQGNILENGKINLNRYPDKYPIDLTELQRLLEIVIDHKNKNGFNLKLNKI